LRNKFKIGLVGGIAALLVAIGAFGFGGVTTTQADIVRSDDCDPPFSTNDFCVYAVAEHGIDPSVGTTTDYPTCPNGSGWDPADSPFGIVKPDEALHIDTFNFPPQSGSFPLSASVPLLRLQTGDSILICVNAQGIDDVTTGTFAGDGDLSFDSNDNGTWDRPACGPETTTSDGLSLADGDDNIAEWPDDRCNGPIGTGTDHMIVPADPPGPSFNDLTTVIARFNCGSFVGTTRVTIQQDQNSFQFNITCRDDPDDINLTCSPCTVEIVPARSNTSHSLIQAFAIDEDDDNTFAIVGADVDFKTDRCAIETAAFLDDDDDNDNGILDYLDNIAEARKAFRALSVAIPETYADFDDLANEYGVDETGNGFGGAASNSDTGESFDVDLNVDGTMAAAWLHCDVHSGVTTATPGVATITACWEVEDGADLCKAVQVTVIGPPASITVAASPTSLRCGEKSTVTATVKDAIGQNVSDHTRVEYVTNLGGTLAGTGGVAGFAGPVVPISSNVGDTFGGVSTVFLVTSEVTSGPYEVVATSGGTSSSDYRTGTYLGGVFSTPPVSAQVTVTCNIPPPSTAAPAPTVTAPRTGTGVTPPNTGDAGLADTSGASWALFAIGGIVALSVAGFATVKAARR
jgi:hypothetical protein